jgi:hypothetical protein
LSCFFYLYRFCKYVSYGFPIINFCILGVHYKTPCIYENCKVKIQPRKLNHLAAQFFLVCLFLFFTCFGRLCAHHQEKKLYVCVTCYLSFCVDDCLVCRAEYIKLNIQHYAYGGKIVKLSLSLIKHNSMRCKCIFNLGSESKILCGNRFKENND